ncbi:Putative transposase [Mesorhizobium muleiense]|uniref:Putative transposase n=1 Tax=Mesorhizobium muleiense TaxID=1004279 RepID=A0A1G8L1Q8_9HYPH|nr:Putative transposase [Mesorhizobium muleiense]
MFRAASEALLTIAADPKHLGARIGITAVLHSWGSAMTHHPHVHMIVPGGGISLDGERWVHCRPGFFLPVRVLSKLFRRLFLSKLADAHAAGRLQFFGGHDGLNEHSAFAQFRLPDAGPGAKHHVDGRRPQPFTGHDNADTGLNVRS